ncbi:MAG: radical SAM protein [Deltaproteobacteria bacterium]|nr:radical SAM protein [Deltaproteobacteria bacterium]
MRFSWMCILHPLSFGARRDRLVPLMARAGCNSISFGAQSANAEILKNVDRYPRETRALERMLNLCRQSGVLSIMTYIFGLPGETAETIRESTTWSLRHRPHLVDYHPLFVLYGSEIKRRYGDAPVTTLPQDTIEKACAAAFRRFYLRPGTAWRLLSFVVRRNPAYLLRAAFAVKRLFALMLESRGVEFHLSPTGHAPSAVPGR